ncbi:MAG: hypothetical protein R3B91_19845 [Planctomycetaceae bacterium]
MQLSDDCMRMYYELLTDLPMQEVDTILAGHPKEAKVTLAKHVISEYHDAGSADESAARWQREIGDRSALPEEIPIAMVSRSELSGDGTIPSLRSCHAQADRFCPSTSDARRAIQQGAREDGRG